MKLGVFVGSIRTRSWSKKVAQVLTSMLPHDWEAEFFDIEHIPFYNQDWDDDDIDVALPAAAQDLREKVEGIDAFLFVTPEYNRSIPAVLKNAIDVMSRPAGTTIASGKPALVASVSTGAMAGFGANQALRQPLMALGIQIMPQPDLYLGNIQTSFGYEDSEKLGTEPDLDKDLAQLNASTTKFLQQTIDKFADFAARWIEK